MFDQPTSSTGHPTIAHRVVGLGVIALAALAAPSFGIPVAIAAASYGIVRRSNPDKILRGHRLSPEQQHRAGLVLGTTILAFGILYGVTDFSLELAHSLEHKLHHAIEAAYMRGDVEPGEIFTVCRGFVCARATIVQPATGRRLGVASLSGFAIHDANLFGWRQPVEQAAAGTIR